MWVGEVGWHLIHNLFIVLHDFCEEEGVEV